MMRTLPRIAGWVVVIAVLLSALALGGNRPPAWIALGVVVFGAAVLILPAALRLSDEMAVAITQLSLGYAVLLAWALVQTLPDMPGTWAHPHWALITDGLNTIAADPLAARHNVLRLATHGLVFAVVAIATAGAQRAATLLAAIAVFGAVVSCLVISSPLVPTMLLLDDPRSTAPLASFANRNALASFCTLAMLTNLGMAGYWLARRHPGPKDMFHVLLSGAWLFLLGAAVCGFAILETGSRAGAVSAAIAAGIFVVLCSAHRRKALMRMISIGVIGLAAFLATNSFLAQRAADLSGDMPRFILFRDVLSALADRPVLGHGLSGFQSGFANNLSADLAFGEWRRAHNSLLENAYELGLPAAGLFAILIGLVFARLWRATSRDTPDRWLTGLSIAALCAAAIHGLFDFTFQFPANAALLACVAGMGWGISFSTETATLKIGVIENQP